MELIWGREREGRKGRRRRGFLGSGGGRGEVLGVCLGMQMPEVVGGIG